VLWRKAGIAELLLEARIARHRRIDLPRNQHGLLARLAQVGDADEIPLRIGADIDQLCLRVMLQGFPGLSGWHILDHLFVSGCKRTR